jgi:hypothetical protein
MSNLSITYVSSGQNAPLYFNFPFFQEEDVKVKINGVILPMSQYAVQKNAGGLDSDFPYEGGSVELASVPPQGTPIVVYRDIMTRRVVDYQPTEAPRSQDLNRDMNQVMEKLKEFEQKFAEMAVLDTVPALQGLIDRIHDMQAQLDDMDYARASDIPAVDGKMDASGGNASFGGEVGTSAIARIAMPSNRNINLTLGPSGAQYIAPANGYYQFGMAVGVDSPRGIRLKNVTTFVHSSGYATLSNNIIRVFIPCRKGDVIEAHYSATGAVEAFMFIYAEGA